VLSTVFWIRSRLRKICIRVLEEFVLIPVAYLIGKIGSSGRGGIAEFFLNRALAFVAID
jgi:hypothetical protein